MAKKTSATKTIQRMELTERRKDLQNLKRQIKSTPSGSAKDKLLKDASKLAQEVENLTAAAR